MLKDILQQCLTSKSSTSKNILIDLNKYTEISQTIANINVGNIPAHDIINYIDRYCGSNMCTIAGNV